MTLSLTCPCGQQLTIDDQYAGQPVECPACKQVTTAPKRAAAVRAAVVEEDEPAPPKPKKTKKKKKKRAAHVETDEELYERLRENDERRRRVFRGSAFLVLGLAIVAGIAFIFLVYRKEVQMLDVRAILGLGVMGLLGLAAIGKGAFGLLFGQFLGEDD